MRQNVRNLYESNAQLDEEVQRLLKLLAQMESQQQVQQKQTKAATDAPQAPATGDESETPVPSPAPSSESPYESRYVQSLKEEISDLKKQVSAL